MYNYRQALVAYAEREACLSAVWAQAMAYVNQAVPLRERVELPSSRRQLDQLTSLAMANFDEPTLRRLYKIKSPLNSASSLLFLPRASAKHPQPSGGLLVADPVAAKIVR